MPAIHVAAFKVGLVDARVLVVGQWEGDARSVGIDSPLVLSMRLLA